MFMNYTVTQVLKIRRIVQNVALLLRKTPIVTFQTDHCYYWLVKSCWYYYKASRSTKYRFAHKTNILQQALLLFAVYLSSCYPFFYCL